MDLSLNGIFVVAGITGTRSQERVDLSRYTTRRMVHSRRTRSQERVDLSTSKIKQEPGFRTRSQERVDLSIYTIDNRRHRARTRSQERVDLSRIFSVT